MSSVQRIVAGVPVSFPFAPYPAQMAVMAKTVAALNSGHHALLEAPTGSGTAIYLYLLQWSRSEISWKSPSRPLLVLALLMSQGKPWRSFAPLSHGRSMK